MANIDELLDGICATVYELEEPIKKIVEELGPEISILFCADRERDRMLRPSFRFTFIISHDYTPRRGDRNGR